METNAAIIILTPMMIPLASKLGIDPVHLGMVMVLNLMIGLLTPPIGMCLYAVARVAKVNFDKMVKAVAPFYIPLFLVLLLITLFPQIVLILPSIALGY
jgi:TRAP-type C4-dicarboxylate transport system permease large subunit